MNLQISNECNKKNHYIDSHMSHANNYEFTKGPAAATISITVDNLKCQLTLDWSYDSFYYKYKDDLWTTLSCGPKGYKHEIEKINTQDKMRIFKILADYAYIELSGYSGQADISISKLREITKSLNH